MILVTGASGFLGKAISSRLKEEVVTLSRRRVESGTEHISLDLSDSKNTEELADKMREFGVRQIVHAAAVTPWSKNPEYSQDMAMARNLVKATHDAQVDKLYFLSGWNVYAADAAVPYSEKTPLGPEDAYATSKANVETYLSESPLAKKTTILRLSSVYGPGQTSDGLIPNLVTEALVAKHLTLRAKTTRRDYIYIDDVVRAVEKLVYRPESDASIINIGSGQSIAVHDVALAIAKLCGRQYGHTIDVTYKNTLTESPLQDNTLSIEKAKNLGLLRDTTPFVVGLDAYISWRQHENIL